MAELVLDFLRDMLGEKIFAEDLTLSERKKAGLLVNLYVLKTVSLRGRRYIFAFAKADQRYTPVAVAKQLQSGCEALGVQFVYVPRELGPHDISRLVFANVPFVFPNTSMFLPDLGLSVLRKPRTPVLRETFSVPAQLLVLGYILKKWNGHITIADGIDRVGFSSASIVHAFQEIEHFGAGERENGSDGRTVRIRLKTAHEIWEICRHRFFNPCKRVIGVATQPDGSVVAGIDALAAISNLNEDVPTCFAMPLKGFRARGIAALPSTSASCKLQLWHYPPSVLGGDRIDPASLFLSLQDELDDRVQIELDKLQEMFKW